jgi:regulator of nucleoside diphosphate kinase
VKRSIFITDGDRKRLKGLLESARRFLTRDHEHLKALDEDLEQAEVVPARQVPADVVSINSQVRLRDMDTGAESEYRLVFPREANVAKGRISVLAPIGTAILGYRVGETVEVQAPVGRKRLKVKWVLYQPEAADDAA